MVVGAEEGGAGGLYNIQCVVYIASRIKANRRSFTNRNEKFSERELCLIYIYSMQNAAWKCCFSYARSNIGFVLYKTGNVSLKHIILVILCLITEALQSIGFIYKYIRKIFNLAFAKCAKHILMFLPK